MSPPGVPVRPPAQSKHESPVQLAVLPWASTMPTWRCERRVSVRSTMRIASGAEAPSSISSSPRSPYAVLPSDCVATAPTPARAQGTMPPTFGNLDCTATPRSPVTES